MAESRSSLSIAKSVRDRRDALAILWRIRPKPYKRTGRFFSVADTAKARSARVILSRSIRRLEARSLVERTSRSHYALTPEGRTLAQSLHGETSADVAPSFAMS